MQGFFGKIPGHRDFVTRELPREFLDVWDGWLQACIADSRATLGAAWLDTYLTSPIWRFAMKPGICGEAWAGLLMPSVDGVGRYFPLTIAARLEPEVSPYQVATAAGAWFDAAEQLALRTLDDDRFDADALLAALAAIGEPGLAALPGESLATLHDTWSLAVQGAGAGDVAAAVADRLTSRQARAFSLWWSSGTEAAAPSALVVPGLPNPRGFVELLRASFGHDQLLPAAGVDRELERASEAGAS